MANSQMVQVINPIGHLRKLIVPRLALLGAAGWIAAQHAVQQFLRLGTNVVLARLLSPELLGTMLLINTFRTGGELLTDVGIGQSIVSNPKGKGSNPPRPANGPTLSAIQMPNQSTCNQTKSMLPEKFVIANPEPGPWRLMVAGMAGAGEAIPFELQIGAAVDEPVKRPRARAVRRGGAVHRSAFTASRAR